MCLSATWRHAAEDTAGGATGGATLPSMMDDEDERASSTSEWGSASAHSSDQDDDDDDAMHDALDLEHLAGRKLTSSLSVPDIHGDDDELDHDSGTADLGEASSDSPKRGRTAHVCSEGCQARFAALEEKLVQESRRSSDLEAQLAAQVERTAALENTVAHLVASVTAMQQQQQVDE